MQELYDDLVAITTDHGTYTSTQHSLTQDNITVLNTLNSFMQSLFADGKDLYRTSNRAKLADYTYRQLLKRLRREQPAGAPAAKDSPFPA